MCTSIFYLCFGRVTAAAETGNHRRGWCSQYNGNKKTDRKIAIHNTPPLLERTSAPDGARTPFSTENHIGFSQITIQCVPKRSVAMPKRLAKKVSAIGIPTVPPSDSAAKMRSASSGVSTPIFTA